MIEHTNGIIHVYWYLICIALFTSVVQKARLLWFIIIICCNVVMLLMWDILWSCIDHFLGYSSLVVINCLSISLARRHHFLRFVNERGPGVLIICCQPLSPYCHPSLSTFSSSSPVISIHQSLSVHTQLLIIVLLTCLSKSWIVDLVSLGNLYSSFDMMGFNWLSVLYTNTAVSTTISRLKNTIRRLIYLPRFTLTL